MKALTSLCAIGILAGAMAMPARAQFVVVDPANLIQTTITAIQSLAEVENQIKQLTNEAIMLENEAKNLTSLDYSALNRLLATLARTDQLIAQARGLGFELVRAEQAFANRYPTEYADTVSNDQMIEDAHERWSNSLEALRTAIDVQSQAQANIVADTETLGDLVDQSQSAIGALQATQATNQILALHARQMMAEQQLRITQDRAIALEQARAIAAEERARNVRRHFNAEGVPYTPTGTFTP